MSEIERVLQELESATAIVAGPAKDLDAARVAMDRRQRAIAELSRLTGALTALSQGERENALRRLQAAKEAGAKVEQWLTAVKSDIMAEWNQWSHIYRALGAASVSKPTLVDYKC